MCFLLTSTFIERGQSAPQPSTWRGRSEQISLDQVGCEARKIPAGGDVFLLDFSLYRTNQELAASLECDDVVFNSKPDEIGVRGNYKEREFIIRESSIYVVPS